MTRSHLSPSSCHLHLPGHELACLIQNLNSKCSWIHAFRSNLRLDCWLGSVQRSSDEGETCASQATCHRKLFARAHARNSRDQLWLLDRHLACVSECYCSQGFAAECGDGGANRQVRQSRISRF